MNINSVIVLELSKDQVSFVSNIKFEPDIDATIDWDIVITKTNLLAVFAAPISMIYNYRIFGIF